VGRYTAMSIREGISIVLRVVLKAKRRFLNDPERY
jgi:hypothetical protein